MPRRALTLLLSVSFLVLSGASARADVTCVFDEAVMAVQLSAPIVPISVVRSGMEIVVLDGDDPVDCGTPAPTVGTTDEIQVTDLTPGSSAFTIDLSGGPFESSGSKLAFDVALGGGSSDALLVNGSSSADHMTLAGAGIDLDATSDPGPHVALSGVELVVVDGAGGDDTLDAGDPIDPFLRVVELRGGDGADTLIGGDAGDLLVGGGGADDLLGGDGPDVLRGGAGIDSLDGGQGDDLLAGGPGDDEEAGGPGNDIFDQGTAEDGEDDLDGGAGQLDVVAYDLRTEAVTVVLDGPSVSGEAGEGDAVAGIEVALGGAGDDSLTGAGGDDSLRGGPGQDVLVGGGGDDYLAGGPGQDHLNGGVGDDTASFFGASGPVEASLADGVAVTEGEQDTLQGIQNLDGSRHADVLVGDDGPNMLMGRGGADRLIGGGGEDTLDGGDQHDDLRGGVGNDLLHGREGADLLQGGSGNDALRGGPGRDTASFRTSSSGVRASLAAGSATGQG
ncbi:MAG TPA: calcium-binding protein, partial [Actinomycetota bacterium]